MGLFKRKPVETSWDAGYAERLAKVQADAIKYSAKNLRQLGMRNASEDYDPSRVHQIEAEIKDVLYNCASRGNYSKLVRIESHPDGFYLNRDYLHVKPDMSYYKMSNMELHMLLGSLSLALDGVRIEKHWTLDGLLIDFDWSRG